MSLVKKNWTKKQKISKKKTQMDSFLEKTSNKKSFGQVSMRLNDKTTMAILKNQNIKMPKLQNIVATTNLNCELDLKNIALHARNAEYNPRRFAAVVMRLR